MRALVLLGLFAVGCVASRERGGRDLAGVDDRDLSVDDGDLAGVSVDLRAAKDGGGAGDMVKQLDQKTDGDDLLASDLAFPSTDLQSAALVPGDTCADAPVLPLGVLITAQTTDDVSVHDDYHFWGQLDLGSSPCDSLTAFQYDGPDTVYKVDVPTGKTLRVQAQSQLGWDLTVALFTDCAMPAPSCVADADDALPIGNPEQVEYTNGTGSTQTVFVVVDGWDTPEKGSYTIQAVLQ